MKAASLTGVLLVALSLPACSALNIGVAQDGGVDAGPQENTAPPVDALTDPKHPGIELCSSKLTTNEVEDNLEIARDFKESCHELVVCGGLAAQASVSIQGLFLNVALGKLTGSGNFTYVGAGKYKTNNTLTGTSMDLTFALGFDTSFGKKGDPIPFDLFSVDSYFKGAQITASAFVNTKGESGYSLGFGFTGVGPAVELLGLGAQPASPLKVDSKAISDSLGQILLSAKVHVDDTQGHAHFVYDLTAPPAPMGPMSGGTPLPMNLDGVTGARADLGQTMTVSKWDIRFLNTSASGFMDGTIAFDIKGGTLFSYGATFEYPRRKTPDVTLVCH
jgi:hypothetical protein